MNPIERAAALSPRVRYAPAVGWAALVVGASVIDPPTAGVTPPGPLGLVGLDKWVHLLAYAGLAALLAGAALAPALAARAPPDRRVVATLLAVVAVATAFGVGVELVQGRLPARSLDAADAVANAAGAALAALGWWLLARAGARRDLAAPDGGRESGR